MGEWKTIDTAPKDERVILLYWHKTGHIEDGRIDREGNHILFDGQSLNDSPTHWMPLPDAPTQMNIERIRGWNTLEKLEL